MTRPSKNQEGNGQERSSTNTFGKTAGLLEDLVGMAGRTRDGFGREHGTPMGDDDELEMGSDYPYAKEMSRTDIRHNNLNLPY